MCDTPARDTRELFNKIDACMNVGHYKQGYSLLGLSTYSHRPILSCLVVNK